MGPVDCRLQCALVNMRQWYLLTGNVFLANSLAMGSLGYATHVSDCYAVAIISLAVGLYSLYRGYTL